jgi:hypothetical protein
MEWLLYLLVFVFGYYTCKTFYVFSSGATTVTILKITYLTSLLVLLKALEQYEHIKKFGSQQLQRKGATDIDVENYKMYIDNDIRHFKSKSVNNILGTTPTYFKEIPEFSDWDSAMEYLDANKILVDHILNKSRR